jgi:hypothetical protein
MAVIVSFQDIAAPDKTVDFTMQDRYGSRIVAVPGSVK